MTKPELRLRCLELAAQRQGARDTRPLTEIADALYQWVEAVSPHPAGKRKGAAVKDKES